MSRPSRSGVRGLFKEQRYFDSAGKPLRKAEALARIKAGAKLKRRSATTSICAGRRRRRGAPCDTPNGSRQESARRLPRSALAPS